MSSGASAGDGNENAAKESCRTSPTRTPSPHPDRSATKTLRLDPPGSAIQTDLRSKQICDPNRSANPGKYIMYTLFRSKRSKACAAAQLGFSALAVPHGGHRARPHLSHQPSTGNRERHGGPGLPVRPHERRANVAERPDRARGHVDGGQTKRAAVAECGVRDL